jgi:hypothetical protein
MSLRRVPARTLTLTLVAGSLLASCRSQASQATPTLSRDQIQTLAVGTFSAELTTTALAVPTDTPTTTATPTQEVTSTPQATNAPATVPNPGIIPTATCYGLTFVSDVTIPDNTTMTPGHKFTKTWRVRNSGTCSWEAGWGFKLTGGEAMGGSTLILDKAVKPGDETSLSVELVAPSSSGSHRGNWRMTTGSGVFFGDEVYVLIVVGEATSTATVKASSTLTATATETLAPSDTPTVTETP